MRRTKFANSENIRPLSADVDGLLALSDLKDLQQEVMDTRQPFVVRHISTDIQWDGKIFVAALLIYIDMLSGIS